MHLIVTNEDTIYDLESGRLYTNMDDSIFMVDNPNSLGLSIATDERMVKQTWAYLLTLCRNRIAANPDATKAQDAPQLTEADAAKRLKFRVGAKVRVKATGDTGYITKAWDDTVRIEYEDNEEGLADFNINDLEPAD